MRWLVWFFNSKNAFGEHGILASSRSVLECRPLVLFWSFGFSVEERIYCSSRFGSSFSWVASGGWLEDSLRCCEFRFSKRLAE